MSDEEKALVEIGKEIGREAVAKASKFLEALLIPPLEQVGLLAHDQIKFLRWKNRVRICLKSQEYLEKKGIQPRKVAIKTLVPLLEYGSLEEDSSMQERWAALLANAADPKTTHELTLPNIEILKQLSPIEAKILDIMFELHPIRTQKHIDHKKRDEEVMKRGNVTQTDYHILQSNLIRLGLIEEVFGKTPIRRLMTNVPKFHTVKGPTELTDVGYLFVQQCRMELPSEKTQN